MMKEDIQKQLVSLMSLFLLVATVFFIVLTASTVNKMKNPAPMQNYITVNGTGKSMITPDLSVINFGVRSQAPTTQEAQEKNTQTTNALIAAIKGLDITQDDLKTQNYNIYEDFTYNAQTGERESIGWVVTQTLEIKVRDTAKVSSVLNLAGQYGVTDVNGPNFQIDDTTVYKAEARAAAIADAKKQAAALSASLGVKLVEVTGYSEWSDEGYYPRYYAETSAMDMSAAAPQVQPGQNEVALNVSLTYTIR